MFIGFSGRFVKALTTALLTSLVAIALACGGSTSAPPASGASTGNWQFNLLQNYPVNQANLNVSGFMVEGSGGGVTASLEVPALGTKANCGGVSSATGNISGQNVTLALNVFGTVINLTGTVSSDGTTMSGDYQGPAGACFPNPTTGTWNAFLVPPLNGSFTGNITDSSYMQTLLGVSPPAPIAVSGTLTQSDNAGGSNATLTGTINAVGYPCFATATVTGTISGQNVYLDLYGYNGNQIGIIGEVPSSAGQTPAPAMVTLGTSGISLTSSSFLVGLNTSTSAAGSGPCPPAGPSGILFDSANLAVTLQ